MRDTHGAVRHVYVLAARTGRPIGVNTQVFVLDVHFDIFIDLGRNEHRSERRLSASARRERRDANQTVNTGLRCEQSIRVITLDAKCGGFQPSLASRLLVQDLHLKALPLGPTKIHSQKHLTEILSVRSAGSRLQRTDRVVRVRFTRKQRLDLRRGHIFFKFRDQRLEFGTRIGIAFREFKEHFGVRNARFKILLLL